MKVGDLVKVETKHYGVKIGLLAEKVVDSFGEGWMVISPGLTRKVYSDAADIEVISESR